MGSGFIAIGPSCSLPDPTTQQVDLGAGEPFPFGRHLQFFIGRRDANQHFAAIGLSRHNRASAGVGFTASSVGMVQAQAAVLVFRSMTINTMRFKNGLDIAPEIHLIGEQRSRRGQAEQSGERETDHAITIVQEDGGGVT